jgi:diguanylate cyclase (GGDEF)-like protein/PAS domain S-box-containing protein
LVVDDDPDLRRLLTIALGAQGWSVVTAGNGRAGLDLALAGTGEVVVLDLGLPDMDGNDVLAALKKDERTSAVPVVMLSGRCEPALVAAMLDAGAQDFLVKPCAVSELVARVGAAHRLAAAQHELRSELAFSEAVLEASNVMVTVLDPEGRVLRLNQACAQMTGWDPAVVTGRSIKEVLQGDLADRLMAWIDRGLDGQAGKIQLDLQDSGRHLVVDVAPIVDSDGVLEKVLLVTKDITASRHQERARQLAEARYRTAFEAAPVGMAQIGLDGCFLEVNRALCDMLGFDADDLVGRQAAAVSDPDDAPRMRELLATMARSDIRSHTSERRLAHSRGHPIWVSLSAATVEHGDGEVSHVLAHYLDINDRKRFEGQLQYLADHDPLTGLRNRRSFEEELRRQAARVARYGPAGALLVLDLDNFKQVNDTLGHNAGDELIVSMADLLRHTMRESDVVARLGGDEFAIILPYASLAEAETVAAKIVTCVRDKVTVLSGDHYRRVTTSIGLALFDDPGLSGDEVLVNADLTMYDAKEAGRDRYAVYNEALFEPRTKARLAWVDRINEALDDDRFVLYAQPILDLGCDRVTRHELLLRMLDEHGDVIPPASFLYVAERVGLIGRIDRWVASQAIKLLADPRLPADIDLEVNLSGRSLGDPDLLDVIKSGLAETGVDSGRLVFEITETAAVANIHLAREFAENLTEIGCRFALDDFGAGFGSFYYLKHLPFDYLKIDGEFVAKCLTNPTDRLVIEALVGIARGLNKKTVAEFVGDQDTLVFLQRLGVDYAQGYHVGRPVPLTEVLADVVLADRLG